MTLEARVDTHPPISPHAASRPRFAAITFFRAVAIIGIVAGHSFGVAGLHPETRLDDTLSNLIYGCTALFVFISGFLFDYVYGARYAYKDFLLDRAKKLLIPYGVLTLLAAVMFLHWNTGVIPVHGLLRYFVLGDSFQAYWYVPFIMMMFVLAPLHRLFISLEIAQQTGIIIIGMIVAGLVQRPIGNDNVLQSVVFYFPLYLAGLFLSLHFEALMPLVKKIWPLLLLGAIFLALMQANGGQSGNLHKEFFRFDGFELMGIQKLLLSLALIGGFATLRSPPNRIVKLVADTSFAIFFLHPFVLKLLGGKGWFQLTPLPWINLVVTTAAIIAFCAVLALCMRWLLNENSKYITGY